MRREKRKRAEHVSPEEVSSSTFNTSFLSRRNVRIIACCSIVLITASLYAVAVFSSDASPAVGNVNDSKLQHTHHDEKKERENHPQRILKSEAEASVAGGGVKDGKDGNEHEESFHHRGVSSESANEVNSGNAYERTLTNLLQREFCSAAAPSSSSSSDSLEIASPSTFDPLTSFSFWGTTMNTSSACPTSGMNNQIAMLLGLMYCASRQQPLRPSSGGPLQKETIRLSTSTVRRFVYGASASQSHDDAAAHHKEGRDLRDASTMLTLNLPRQVFRFKDISCSPTGGKEGAKSFKVGSADYEYAWFRWSEVFDVHGEGAINALQAWNPPARFENALSNSTLGVRNSQPLFAAGPSPSTPTVRVCLRDTYTWSEHAWMKARTCATTVDHFYGTPHYWQLRSLLPLHKWFYALAYEFLAHEAKLLLHSHSNNAKKRAMGVREKESLENNNKNKRMIASMSDASTASSPFSFPSLRARTLAIHVRRGDYYNFCKGTAKSSGVKKFRIAPFVWMKGGGAKAESAGLDWTQQRRQTEVAAGAGDAPPPASLPHYNAKFLNITSVATLSSKFMDSCAPSDDRVIGLVEKVLLENKKACGLSAQMATATPEGLLRRQPSSLSCIDTLLVMTNSGQFYEKIKAHFAAKEGSPNDVNVVSMREWQQRHAEEKRRGAEGEGGGSRSDADDQTEKGQKSSRNTAADPLSTALQRVRWPARPRPHSSSEVSVSSNPIATSLTTTEFAMMDVALLSLADHVILNRYSTFSQSAIDLRAIREGTLEGLRLYWW